MSWPSSRIGFSRESDLAAIPSCGIPSCGIPNTEYVEWIQLGRIKSSDPHMGKRLCITSMKSDGEMCCSLGQLKSANQDSSEYSTIIRDACPNVDPTNYFPVSVHGDLGDLSRAEAGNGVV